MTMDTQQIRDGSDAAFEKYVELAAQCQANEQSFRYFENSFDIPAHMSPVAWSEAAKRRRHSP